MLRAKRNMARLRRRFSSVEEHLSYRSLVDYHTPKTNGSHCINSTLKAGTNGYTAIGVNGKAQSRHRFSFELSHRKLKEAELVMHLCNNKVCINPEHLISGGYEDNNSYTVECGRAKVGEAHHLAKLDEYDVRRVRIDYATGLFTKVELAKEYGLTPQPMGLILNNKTWKHVS